MAVADTIIALRNFVRVSNVKWKNEDHVEFHSKDSIDFELLRALAAGDIFSTIEDTQLQQAFDLNKVGAVPSGVKIILRVSRICSILFVGRSLKDLLSVSDCQETEPAAYVLLGSEVESGFFSHVFGEPLDDAPQELIRYHQAIRFWKLLKFEAQHVDTSSGALLFFGIRRIEIYPGLNVDYLAEDIWVSEVEEFLTNPDRKETRSEIFRSVLSEFLRDHTGPKALRWLLRGSQIFARRLKEGLAIYLSEHSPEKLAEEARGAALGLSEKLEKLISGLEVKSLSIPAAVLLAIKEIEPGVWFSSMNCIIASSTLAYGITMVLVHRSQTMLLGLLKTTINGAKKELQAKGLDADNPALRDSFESLKGRSRGALIGSWVMVFCSWAPLVFAILVMIYGHPKKDPLVEVVVKLPTPVPTMATPLVATPSPSATATPVMVTPTTRIP